MKGRALTAALFAAAAFFYYIAGPATAAPSPSPTPTPSAPATPIPQNLTPPAGWKQRLIEAGSGTIKADLLWYNPNGWGILMTGHFDLTEPGATDLATAYALMHREMIAAAGAGGVQPSTRVKLCGGKQDGTLTKVTIKTYTEEVVLAVSDRAYMAQYTRPTDSAENSAAMHSLFTLCAP